MKRIMLSIALKLLLVAPLLFLIFALVALAVLDSSTIEELDVRQGFVILLAMTLLPWLCVVLERDLSARLRRQSLDGVSREQSVDDVAVNDSETKR